ncbi:MAG TPA: PLD nuclease N-terminal domain-containing protein [Nitriliruptoraceae bacterium]|nr:PLD nuclease N-terminal domain-containing protein [Nitriliruptoraceae bacterium]
MDTGVDVNWAAVAPLVVAVIGFVAFCLFDLSRSEVKHLPKWAWALVCVLSVPLGGIAYLLIGRESR